MWDREGTHFSGNDEFGGFGGGFMPNTTAAADGLKNKSSRGKQSVVSVVVQEILQCDKDDFVIWECNPLHVKIVGILEKLDVESSMYRYKIADHTGSINGMVTVGDNVTDKEEANRFLQVVENTYVKVKGTVSVIDSKKCIVILSILPIKDYNEYITHLLEAIHIRFSLEKRHQDKNSTDIRIKASGTELGNSMYNFSNANSEKISESSDMQGLSNFQQKVYRYIREASEVAGMSSKEIRSKFSFPDHKEVDTTLEFLLSMGYTYTTIDEDHFRATNEHD